MRYPALLLLLGVSACGRGPVVDLRQLQAIDSPVLRERCEGPVATPARLPAIRTVAQLLADRDAQDRARQIDAGRIVLCQERLRQVQTWARQELERLRR